ncbi:SDR family oxidoreductase [Ramlibacter sp. G-1-2-2]|uniref:SDR family oxidoreductase n=1 Tax=Ramlibacter agri TaxID=2728837 RepID=A0A848H7Z8_9BURK|nr:SDR family oxidoreductase [Ramlibacter agri]NML47116.1 SDR family oxidoreductase [Ramlibacter agri]
MQGKVALVTGGAGGLGQAICAALAGAGASVVAGYNRSAAAAEALALRLPRPVPEAIHAALAAPVTDSQALATLAEDIARLYARCDILVNCAGITRYVPHADLDALDDALVDDILATNVRGVIATVRAMRGLLERSGNALVVNISSIAGRTAMGSNIAYCASKAAVDNLTFSLARALAPAIRVVSVSPGLADTDFVQQMDRAWRDEQAGRTPLKRLAAPEEVGLAVLAAATHLSFSTGVVIPVDGGRPLQ